MFDDQFKVMGNKRFDVMLNVMWDGILDVVVSNVMWDHVRCQVINMSCHI